MTPFFEYKKHHFINLNNIDQVIFYPKETHYEIVLRTFNSEVSQMREVFRINVFYNEKEKLEQLRYFFPSLCHKEIEPFSI